MTGNGSTVLRSVRVEEPLAKWFDEHFPWRGSFPAFVNEALGILKKEFGDREPSHEVVVRAIRQLARKYDE